MAGACLDNKSQFKGLDSVDLLARCIYSEAEDQSLTGKRGVYWVVVNRKAKNSSEFGGNTVAGVILKDGAFAGMDRSEALCPDTGSSAWSKSLSIAQNGGANPIGNCLWFNANWLYEERISYPNGNKHYTFPDPGSKPKKVIEEVVIQDHTFFRVEGY
ncbi:cell wall hydrolase [Desulfoscipio sp. XC116]|uniref:cell wall hydrolase n=1 Tax=Desulfoscipio sp. XC116 TaxID=3144975 RepID=UPI00325AD723